jgi:16S rRNA (adenine1518-N6/adenine1519-N6)-dimethyltransferase
MNGIKAKKHLWQNFLRNPKILEMIVGDAPLNETHVIEVWPGPGDLTAEIMKKCPLSLTLIELDQDMIPLLEHRFSGSTLELYHQDVLRVNIDSGDSVGQKTWITVFEDVTKISLPSYHVYGNIPYYITSPILHHFLYDVSLAPDVAVFTMQKEVADRILARDGSHSVLSLACQLVSHVEKVCDISPNNFTPVPKVWSTCLRFTIKKTDKTEAKEILWIIKKWFSQKRKKLITNLAQNGYEKVSLGVLFEKLWLSENIRAEELSLEDWNHLNEWLRKGN